MFNIDIQYTWLLLFLPLVVAAFDWFLLTKRPDVAALTSTFSCLATFVLSLGLLDRTGSDSFSWLPISDIFSVDLGFVLDPLSSRMMLVVTGIGLLGHVFSLAYMADDKAKTRYFACLSLFMFSMTGIVLANNIAMTFIFWELVGLSSYLLIGQRRQKSLHLQPRRGLRLPDRHSDSLGADQHAGFQPDGNTRRNQ